MGLKPVVTGKISFKTSDSRTDRQTDGETERRREAGRHGEEGNTEEIKRGRCGDGGE